LAAAPRGVEAGRRQCPVAPLLFDGLDGLERRTAGGGDVLDDDDVPALEALALGQTFDQLPLAVLLRLLAYEEGPDGAAAAMARNGRGRGNRYRAHCQAADIVDRKSFQRVGDHVTDIGGSGGMQRRRPQIEVEVALTPGRQLDPAASERALLDQLEQRGAAVAVARLTAHRLHGRSR